MKRPFAWPVISLRHARRSTLSKARLSVAPRISKTRQRRAPPIARAQVQSSPNRRLGRRSARKCASPEAFA